MRAPRAEARVGPREPRCALRLGPDPAGTRGVRGGDRGGRSAAAAAAAAAAAWRHGCRGTRAPSRLTSDARRVPARRVRRVREGDLAPPPLPRGSVQPRHRARGPRARRAGRGRRGGDVAVEIRLRPVRARCRRRRERVRRASSRSSRFGRRRAIDQTRPESLRLRDDRRRSARRSRGVADGHRSRAEQLGARRAAFGGPGVERAGKTGAAHARRVAVPRGAAARPGLPPRGVQPGNRDVRARRARRATRAEARGGAREPGGGGDARGAGARFERPGFHRGRDRAGGGGGVPRRGGGAHLPRRRRRGRRRVSRRVSRVVRVGAPRSAFRMP